METYPHVKYPRTPHLPFSQGFTDDDIHGNTYNFLGDGVMAVVTEKMDGENTTFYNDHYHARSVDSRFHPSRSYVAGFHASIKHTIPQYRRIIVENLYARHSIGYNNLPDYQYGIGVVDLLDNNGNPSMSGTPTFLDWKTTCETLGGYGIIPAPILYVGVVDMKTLRTIFESQDHSQHEGIVVRTFDAFPESDFRVNVAKAVRANHVSTDTHWSQNWSKNSLM